MTAASIACGVILDVASSLRGGAFLKSVRSEGRCLMANAMKSQIWIAVTSYVLVAIIKKRLNIAVSLHSILQVLSLHLFE